MKTTVTLDFHWKQETFDYEGKLGEFYYPCDIRTYIMRDFLNTHPTSRMGMRIPVNECRVETVCRDRTDNEIWFIGSTENTADVDLMIVK